MYCSTHKSRLSALRSWPRSISTDMSLCEADRCTHRKGDRLDDNLLFGVGEPGVIIGVIELDQGVGELVDQSCHL